MKNTKTSYSGDSRGVTSTTSTTSTPTPVTGYTESELREAYRVEWGAPIRDASEVIEVAGYSGSTVTTGLLADGTVSPEYRITAQGERGAEVVAYPEWVRRMKVAGKWVNPEPGFTWYPLSESNGASSVSDESV